MKKTIDSILAIIIVVITGLVSGYIVLNSDSSIKNSESKKLVVYTNKNTEDEEVKQEVKTTIQPEVKQEIKEEKVQVKQEPKKEEKVEIKQEPKIEVKKEEVKVEQKKEVKQEVKTTTQNKKIPVTGIKVSQTQVTLKVGETIKINTTIEPSNATNTNTVWNSENTNVATVSNTVIKGISKGTTNIIVKTADGNKTASIKVTVVDNKEVVQTIKPEVKTTQPKTTTTQPKTTTTQPKTTTTQPKVETKTTKVVNTQIDINNATISSVSSYEYTGSAITHSVTVKYNNKTLVKDTDYSITYKNNINVGTASIIITGKNSYKNSKTINFTIKEKQPIRVESVSINPTSLTLKSNGKTTLDVVIKPSNAANKGVTWSSSNPIIARVDSNGKVVGVKPGTAIITVTTNDGKKTATTKVTVTTSNKEIAAYDSATLKYWVEYVSEPSRVAKHKGYDINNQPTYMITHIWVSDPYNQVKTAITPKSSSSQTLEYPRKVQTGETIINNEIASKGYQNKGLVAINASGMVTHTKDKDGKDKGWCTTCPLDYYGTSIMPLEIYDGRVIRDSTNTQYATIGGGRIGFIDRNGNLTYKWFSNDLSANKTTRASVEGLGAKYTFGMISPGVLITNYNTINGSSDGLATRQAMCQIDKNNFILITSHLNGASAESSCGTKSGLSCPRIVHGLTTADLAKIMTQYGCKTGFNLDGGGSISYYYKTNKTSSATRVKIASGQRSLSDLLYFVEK